MLVEKGAAVLPALKKYMSSADSISWPLRLLDKVVDAEGRPIDVIAEVLERHEPGYERDPTKKIQLLTHLAGLKHARVPPLVAPYLDDMDEGVRYAAVEALLKQGDEAVARAPLLDLFVEGRQPAPAHPHRRRLRRARLARRRPARRGREGAARRVPARGARRRRAHQEETRSEGIADSRAETRTTSRSPGHRLRADRHRPGLRVRLLGHPGRARRCARRATRSSWSTRTRPRS